MLLVDDLIRPESLPRGWTAEFKLKENKWWVVAHISSLEHGAWARLMKLHI
jgi:hypothetical protein